MERPPRGSAAASSSTPSSPQPPAPTTRPSLDAIPGATDALAAQVERGDIKRGEGEQERIFAAQRHELSLALGHQNRRHRNLLIFFALAAVVVFYGVFLCLLWPLLKERNLPYSNWHWLVPLGLTGAIATTLLLVLMKGVFYGANGNGKPEANDPELMPLSVKVLFEAASALTHGKP
ncbi:hypothetical protein [Thiomonas sp. FB-6]|uniref:hypothetical protein n=1 Tax=Thiomonas sp. FB-6 TaxID=1158291 RepID=UPI0012DF101E|nr:hypothetical protein [Thiomonas sp. FB-6]